MKQALLTFFAAVCLLPDSLAANVAPTVVIKSATMRPGTTLMDVVYRVNDPDDATVKTRALAFRDGVRSFANVIKPVTFVEGTAVRLGDAIPSNTDLTLTWDVGADWNIDLGQIKFEVLAMDGGGLLPFDWISIPATAGNPQTSVSKNSPTANEVLNALFWQYATGDSGLSLANGVLTGSDSNGAFVQVVLANGSTPQVYSTPFIFKRMNLDPDDGLLAINARVVLSNPQGWHAANRPYAGVPMVLGWGDNQFGELAIPTNLSGVITMVDAGLKYSLALRRDGTVAGWGDNSYNKATPPAGLGGVTAIAAGKYHSLALKSDGTVVGWGYPYDGQATPPVGLSGVIAIAAGNSHSLALKGDGTVVGWGANNYGQTTPPAGLSGVTAIAAGSEHCLALKSNGTVVGWGANTDGRATPPAGLSGVIAIAAGNYHGLALKSNGTVVGWGVNNDGRATPPAGLSGVIAIAAGDVQSLALKSDGTVVGWGSNNYGQATPPAGLSKITAIAAGYSHSLAIKGKAP